MMFNHVQLTLASSTVYSWYTPEIELLVAHYARHDYPSEVFTQNYDPGLDDLHEELMSLFWRKSIAPILKMETPTTRWDLLPDSYYTNGSSEGLFHLLARHKTHFPHVPLYQFAGEYQGYQEYAKTLGLTFRSVDFGTDVTKLQPGVFFVSVPSAVDGNAVDPSVIDLICERHYVVLDLAYAGMGSQPEIRLTDRVTAVVASMSKPFGLYYHRIGFLWSRDPVPSLYGNRWFKNAFSIKIAQEVLKDYSADYFAGRYGSWQERAIQEASQELGVEIYPSDVWLLGHLYPAVDQGIPWILNQFKRGPGYRFCLTPYYMKYVKEDA